MRVAFTTLGCRVNLFETEAMRRRVRQWGQAQVVSWEDEAEVYVINSCTVTGRAEQKCRQLTRQVKRRHPSARVVVVGCYGQVKGEALLRMSQVDMVLGNEEKRRIDEYLPRVLAGERLLEAESFAADLGISRDEWVDGLEGRSRGLIKIQEGCNLRCAFCSVWKARGPSRSRPPEDVVRQGRILARAGYEEIVLGGVHLGHYGRDLRPRSSLREVVKSLLEGVDERVRFRLSSLDPSELDSSLARMLLEEPRLCRYLHLPLQSGSDRILERMRRPYRAGEYRELIEGIAAADGDFGFGVDVIVGFPGESEDDFERTRSLLESLPVSFYHVFPYSRREGTEAARMDHPVDGRVAARRAGILREMGRHKRRAFLQRHLGRRFDGVVEGTGKRPSGEDLREVMLDNYVRVWARADRSWEGRRVTVEVTGWLDEDALRGRLVAT